MNRLTFQEIHPEDVLVDTRSLKEGRANHLQDTLYFNATNFKKFVQSFIQQDAEIVFITDSQSQADLADFEAIADTFENIHVKGYIPADNISADQIKSIQTISVEDFLNLDDDFTLLDLRHPDEITRPAPEVNLVNIPLENLHNDYDILDANSTIYTLCGSGNRATTAASFLIDKGYDVKVIDGGMKAVNEYLEKG